jgi:sugar/nucleoside kinase (ribokinase family)
MKYELVGIGSALVDVSIAVTDRFLEEHGLPKGGMTLVDAEQSRVLFESFPDREKTFSAGGATANVIAAYAQCGGTSAFIGKTGRDALGDYFTEETENTGAAFLRIDSDAHASGLVICLVTPDGQRTFATHLGASVTMTPEDLPGELLNQAPWLHVEAYLVFNRNLIRHVLDTARANGQKISMDLSSFTVVREHRDYFREILENRNLDLLFANEDECREFCGVPPEEALRRLSPHCETAVVKEGARGSRIARNGETVVIHAEKVPVENTNGAGDAYAGGVLFGMLQGLPPEDAGRIGTRAGGLAVSQTGARLLEENARNLKEFASRIVSESILHGKE